MRHRISWVLISLVLLLVSCQVTPPAQPPIQLPPAAPARGDFVPGRIIVKFKPDVLAAQAAQDLGAQTVDRIRPLSVELVEFTMTQVNDEVQATLEMLSRFQADPRVERAELDYVVEAFETPNDTYFSNQWHLAQIEAPAAWDITHGSSDVIVAIVDTGVDFGHADLRNKLVPGFDFVNYDNDARDDHGHGTHVAGIAAAITGNGSGVAGVCWACTIMPVKALSKSGSGSHWAIANSAIWAADNGADVINMSLGGPYQSDTLKDAMDYAWEKGVVLVAAAGNSGNSTPNYPAAYDPVISVAATDQADRRASFSNYGNWVSVSAPGVQIFSTVYGGDYQAWNGTSMASPVVAGLAGLVVSQDPLRPPADVRAAIEANTDPVGSGLGTGRVNARRALSAAPGTPPAPTASPTVTPTSTQPAPTQTPVADVEARVVQLINEERAAAGLSPLGVDARLVEAARRHSRDMAQNSFCGHFGTDGTDPFDRMNEAGYPAPYGETVACGYQTPESVVSAWMSSTSHRQILLCAACSDIGVGFVQGGRYVNLWTANFGQEGGGPAPTPTPTPSPRPTSTPVRTQTPAPTSTPEPAPSPTPTLERYCLICEDVPGPDPCTPIECP